MNDLLLLQHAQKGTRIHEIPAALTRYVPDWPDSHTESFQYAFGHIVTVSHKSNTFTSICRTTHIIHKLEKFSTTLSQPAVLFHIRVKGPVNVSLSNQHHALNESNISMGYVPAGSIESQSEHGLGISIVTDATRLIENYASQSYQVQQLLQHIETHPDKPLILPSININFWGAGVIRLLLNLGKDAQYTPSFSKCIDRLIRLYLIHMHDDLPAATKEHLCFEVLTGRKAGKTYLINNTPEGKQYHAIESYLLSNLKTHLKKEEVAQAMNMGEKEFVKLFKDGYGKPYREGYLELRMQKAFELVMQGQDKKLYTIARSVGYHQQSAFGERFMEFYGYPPTMFKWPYTKIKRAIE